MEEAKTKSSSLKMSLSSPDEEEDEKLEPDELDDEVDDELDDAEALPPPDELVWVLPLEFPLPLLELLLVLPAVHHSQSVPTTQRYACVKRIMSSCCCQMQC